MTVLEYALADAQQEWRMKRLGNRRWGWTDTYVMQFEVRRRCPTVGWIKASIGVYAGRLSKEDGDSWT